MSCIVAWIGTGNMLKQTIHTLLEYPHIYKCVQLSSSQCLSFSMNYNILFKIRRYNLALTGVKVAKT